MRINEDNEVVRMSEEDTPKESVDLVDIDILSDIRCYHFNGGIKMLDKFVAHEK